MTRRSLVVARAVAIASLCFAGWGCGGPEAAPAARPATVAQPVSPAPSGPTPTGPVRIYHNGKIYTAAARADAHYVKAIAVAGSTIVRTGSDEALTREYPAATRVDLRGRTVVPGFNDAHYHTGPAAPGATHLRLANSDPSTAVLRDALIAEAGKGPPHWVIAHVGLSVFEDASVDRTFLDSISGPNPVFLFAVWGHQHILNSKALDTLGLREDVRDPHAGHFGRTPQGKLNGRVNEYATWLTIRPLAFLLNDADLAKAQAQSFADALSFGITSIQLMSWFNPEPYLRLAAAAPSSPRIRWINRPMSLEEPLFQAPATAPGAGAATVSGIKWLLDGTPNEHGEALGFPYEDGRPSAPPNFSQDDVHKLFADARNRREQLLFHAVGGGAIDQVLREAQSLPAGESSAMRPRIEHADWMQPAQATLAKSLGVVVVQNPSHFTDVGLLLKRRGPERRSMRLASLVRGGLHVALGSDGPVNPYLNMMFAVTHPYWPAEALTREEVVDAYTRESAYAEKAEASKGTLEPGKLADFAVLSQDIFTCPIPELPKTRSVLTVIGGRAVAGSEAGL